MGERKREKEEGGRKTDPPPPPPPPQLRTCDSRAMESTFPLMAEGVTRTHKATVLS